MEFEELIEKRFSVREFKEDKVDKTIIEKILKAGQVAPTACNKQPQRIYVLESKESLEKLKKCTSCHFNAPLAFLVCSDLNECWKREYDDKLSGDIDASIVCTHMMLEAANLGVGSVWVMHYIPEAVKQEFELSDNLESCAILVMGYPKDGTVAGPMHLNKKSLGDTVKYI